MKYRTPYSSFINADDDSELMKEFKLALIPYIIKHINIQYTDVGYAFHHHRKLTQREIGQLTGFTHGWIQFHMPNLDDD